MPVVAGRVYDFEWKTTDEGRINISTGVEAPIAAVLGVDIGMSAGVAFQKAVNRCWKFEKLETFTANITQSYVDDSVETAEVESYIQRHKEWLVKNPSLYIITGIMVGRTAKLSESSTQGRGVNAGAGANASEIAGATGEFDVSRSKTFSSSQRLDDFVFAIRVAKITKGLLDKTWSWATLSDGATFGAGDNSKETIELIKANLEASAHVYEQVVGLGGTAGDIFIL
ncbi:hypothetical protein NUW58_g795 [Xylaria curta]|uniref:Uncharacterized protein n=1 Tax=Xylaria curta TaxID=42375 RepID=A0ACC1PN16_9PEZI|nr:hypothetical protein NUW58_g795 [Xylaria curta]